MIYNLEISNKVMEFCKILSLIDSTIGITIKNYKNYKLSNSFSDLSTTFDCNSKYNLTYRLISLKKLENISDCDSFLEFENFINDLVNDFIEKTNDTNITIHLITGNTYTYGSKWHINKILKPKLQSTLYGPGTDYLDLTVDDQIIYENDIFYIDNTYDTFKTMKNNQYKIYYPNDKPLIHRTPPIQQNRVFLEIKND